jgi:membrane fusion protein (multidrug efflux system)
VPEREYRRIDPGQDAVIHIDALAGSQFDAIVSRVSPVVDPATGTFKITIEVSDSSRRLKPGMFGRINIVYDMHADAMQIPRSAIVEEAGESAIYVIDENVAERRIIRTGYTEGGQIEVLEGLDESEEFVVVGQTSLKNGSRVSIINAVDAGDTAVSNDTSSQ